VSRGRATSEIFAPGILAGRVALVTGGGTGLGMATAQELHRCGAAVAICGRRDEVLERAAAAIADAGSGPQAVSWHAGDVRDPEDARRIVTAVTQRHGALDVLVNNAGGQFFSPAELIAAKGWRAVWRLNAEGMLNMSEAAYAVAMRAHGGTIVNVTLSPHHGMPGMAHSGAARAAVEALTGELARRWATDAITVCAVAAGHFDTEILAKYPAGVRAGAGRTVPLGRLGEPVEHAWLVTLLATPVGRALSGATVTLDGARDNWFGPWPPAGLADEAGRVPVEQRRTR